jgi:hypothetical protein
VWKFVILWLLEVKKHDLASKIKLVMTNNKNLTGWIIVIVLLVAGGIALTISLHKKDKTIKEMAQQFELEKEALTDEYSQLALQYEGYGLRIENDSMAALLEAERYKVQRLLDELKMTKATNAKRINELRKELETLRGVLKSYIAQIDSLNRLNTQLREENKVVSAKYEQVNEQVKTLSEEKKVLTEKVTLASSLEAHNISIEPFTDRKKKTTHLNKIAQIRFQFTIGKNISAPPGEKYIYMRILQPDETPLVKRNDNVFLFEGSYINYSIRRPIEYEGEEMPVTMYWDVEEYLHPGKYRVDIFADGYLIGSKEFELAN